MMKLAKCSAIIATLFATLVLASVEMMADQSLSAETLGWYPTTALPAKIANREAIVHDQFIYLIGGKNEAGNPTTDVYRTQLTSGVLLTSGWTKVTANALPYSLHSHATVATDKYIYVIGGWDGSNARTEIWRAEFKSNGDLGAWILSGKLAEKTQVHRAVIVNNTWIYVLGGTDNNAKPLNTVYYARIQADGNLTPKPTTGLPNPLSRFSAIANSNSVYVIGGYDADKKTHDEIYRSPVNADGSLGRWAKIANLPSARFYTEALVRKGELVVLGGTDGSKTFPDVVAAPIKTDGSLGDWVTKPSLRQPRYRFAAALGTFDDQIYVIGGLDGPPETYHNDAYVLAAPGSVTCTLGGNPTGYLAPGDTVTYTINCTAGPTFGVSNVVISNTVSSRLELVPNSVTGGGTVTGNSRITWSKSALNPNEKVTVFYQAKRPKAENLAITSDPSGLTIHKVVTPAALAKVGDPITYTLVVTNSAGKSISGTFLLTDVLPASLLPITKSVTATTNGVLSQTNSIAVNVKPAITTGTALSPTTIHTVTWTVPNLTLAISQVITAQLPVTIVAAQTISNTNYLANSASGVYHVSGAIAVIVYAGPDKDKFSAENRGAMVTWAYQDHNGGNQAGSARSNTVVNSALNLHIPVILRER